MILPLDDHADLPMEVLVSLPYATGPEDDEAGALYAELRRDFGTKTQAPILAAVRTLQARGFRLRSFNMVRNGNRLGHAVQILASGKARVEAVAKKYWTRMNPELQETKHGDRTQAIAKND